MFYFLFLPRCLTRDLYEFAWLSPKFAMFLSPKLTFYVSTHSVGPSSNGFITFVDIFSIQYLMQILHEFIKLLLKFSLFLASNIYAYVCQLRWINSKCSNAIFGILFFDNILREVAWICSSISEKCTTFFNAKTNILHFIHFWL